MLERKREMRAKIEKVEGTPDKTGTALANDDAFVAINPSVTTSREKIETPSLGGTLSQERSQFGYAAVQANFELQVRGSRVAPVTTPPEADRLFRACGMRRVSLNYLTMDSGAAGSFENLETLSFAPSGATAKVIGTTPAVDGERLYFELLSGTPTVSDTVTGSTSASSTGISDPSIQEGGYKYHPDSTLASSMGIGSWSSGDPSPGDIITKQGSTTIFGVVVAYDSANGILYYEPIWDAFTAGDTVELHTGSNQGSTATAADPITQSRMPSLTLEQRIDGMRREIAGARGTFSLPMQAGQPARFNFEMQGVLTAEDDYLLGAPDLNTEGRLIFRAAKLRIDDKPMKVGAYELVMGNQLAARLDPSAAMGVESMRITGRAPTLRINPERVVPGVHDWNQKWDASTTFATELELGTVEGNRVIVVTPQAQATEISDESRDGILAANINCDLIRGTVGDDEIAIYFV
jgi:hypothetical protein